MTFKGSIVSGLFAAALVMFTFWLGGLDFVRGFPLGYAFATSVIAGGFVFVFAISAPSGKGGAS